MGSRRDPGLCRTWPSRVLPHRRKPRQRQSRARRVVVRQQQGPPSATAANTPVAAWRRHEGSGLRHGRSLCAHWPNQLEDVGYRSALHARRNGYRARRNHSPTRGIGRVRRQPAAPADARAAAHRRGHQRGQRGVARLHQRTRTKRLRLHPQRHRRARAGRPGSAHGHRSNQPIRSAHRPRCHRRHSWWRLPIRTRCVRRRVHRAGHRPIAVAGIHWHRSRDRQEHRRRSRASGIQNSHRLRRRAHRARAGLRSTQ